MIAVESIEYRDKHGKFQTKAGFAKVKAIPEATLETQAFVDQSIEHGSEIRIDGSHALRGLDVPNLESKVTDQNKDILDQWLPWVHTFIANAKRWVLGTHHGVSAKYLDSYLAEFTYRFNLSLIHI